MKAANAGRWLPSDAKTDPPQIFNRRLLNLVITAAFAGSVYGLDTGIIGGVLVLPSFQHAFGLDGDQPQWKIDDRKGTIAAMMAAAASAGALLAAPTADYLGRKWSVLFWAIIYVIGSAVQLVADYHALLAGRFVAGLGLGASSMLTPQFLAENAPKSVRGTMTASYNVMITMSLMIAFFINYGVSLWNRPDIVHTNQQWRASMSIQLIPAAMMCLMILFVPETPRYLISRGKVSQGLEHLCKLRQLKSDHPYVQIEYAEIQAQLATEQENRAGRNYLTVVKDIICNKSNSKRLLLALLLFLFHKLTGNDAMTTYSPEIFVMIGVQRGSSALLTTGVYGVIKSVAIVFYVVYLVDRIGRRRPLLVGAVVQATCMLYLGLYIRIAGTKERDWRHGGTAAGGYVGIVAIYLYAVGWSFGHSVACYVTAAEIFPGRIRSFCMSLCFFLNWIVDYGITKATPHLLRELGWGTFVLFAAVTYVGVVFVFFCLPELKGRSIESMDDLFERPLWMMWRCAYPSDEQKVRHGVQEKVLRGESNVEMMPRANEGEVHAQMRTLAT